MPATRRRTAPEVRREQITEAASAVFGRLGYRQGSLKAVADEVGLTVQGVLHHFGSKEGVLMATLERRNEERSTVVDQVRHTEGVVALMRYLLAENLEQGGFMRLFVTLAAEATDPDHPAHAYFAARYRRTYEDMRASFAADIASGRAPSGLDPSRAAEELIALCDGLQLQKLLRPELDLLTAFDAATARMRRG